MNDISQYSAIVIIMVFLVKEMFSYLKTSKVKKNGNGNYKEELISINEKLGNHLTKVNGKINNIEREMGSVQRDLAIVKNNVNDIKIAFSKK